MNHLAIDPSTLLGHTSLKRPYDSPSPSSSTDSSSARKRPRVSADASSEEKKEARAARNRIAAQESRDRKKREFGELHERVAQLEAENVALRSAVSSPSMSGVAAFGNERTERLERENAELLERGEVRGGAHKRPAPDPRRCSYISTITPNALLVLLVLLALVTTPHSRRPVIVNISRDRSPPSTGGDRRSFSFIGCQGDAPAAGGLALESDALLFTSSLPTTTAEQAINTTTSSFDLPAPNVDFDAAAALASFEFDFSTVPTQESTGDENQNVNLWLLQQSVEETSGLAAHDNSTAAAVNSSMTSESSTSAEPGQDQTLEQTLLSFINNLASSSSSADVSNAALVAGIEGATEYTSLPIAAWPGSMISL